MSRAQQSRNSKNSKKQLAPVIPKAAAKVLQYWQSCLVDAERIEASGRELQHQGVDVSYAELIRGNCSSKTFSSLVDRQESANSAKQTKNSATQHGRFESERVISTISVLVCPLRFIWSAAGNSYDSDMPRFVEILWIPATLTTSGQLLPPTNKGPWISRRLLEPAPSDQGLVVGDLADMEKFSKKNPIEDFRSWEDYWNWCNAFFKAVCGSDIADFQLEDYQKRKNVTLIPDNTSSGSSRQAQRIYQQVLERIRQPGMLLDLSALKDRHQRKVVYTKQNFAALKDCGWRHRGQFGFKYPLSPSQRTAVHQFLRGKGGRILTVTGPPGTGKTTLLQSIIATSMVTSAYNKSIAPPIVVACAGTNQAVTNIIATFAKANTKPGPLAGRWLPDVTSYGCYCPSEAKAQEAADSGIQIERTVGEGLSRQMETEEYLFRARDYFLKCYSIYAEQRTDLENAVTQLHNSLRREVSAIYREISKTSPSGLSQWLLSFFKEPSDEDYIRLQKTLENLDCTHRHTAFQLATHYWEGRWILSAETLLKRRTRKDRHDRLPLQRRDWQRRAMITPCFVGTFATAPRFFGTLTDDNKPLIDLLIVDEASQVLPEEGAACFALADRALVVGDTKQLEPVRTIPEHLDIQNLKKFGLLKNDSDEELEPLLRKGITSAHGSVMELAQNACLLIDDNIIGAFLTEHRRCVPGVIAFCNKWSYRGRLKPLRLALTNPILPALGYAHIPGSSNLVGSSRENVFEAEVITKWLADNRRRIETAYGGQELQNLLAIITPFAAQKRRFEKLLRQQYPQMTIGTVHGLQGAERAIVIFSPVYDQFVKTDYFFDRDEKMLNVAVSRAQDSFLVFGDMAIFKTNSTDKFGAPLASAMLASFLLADPNNELTDIVLPTRKELAQSELQRITTLEGHQSLLRQAFEIAEEEVLIVSPTISSRAIEHDNIAQMITQTISRGVKVSVYVDTYLNQQDESGELKTIAAEGCELIQAAGAKLYFVNGIHNKTLAIDDSVIVEGSFNWLSAVRDVKSKHQKYEISICYSGPEVAKEIRRTKEVLAHLISKR